MVRLRWRTISRGLISLWDSISVSALRTAEEQILLTKNNAAKLQNASQRPFLPCAITGRLTVTMSATSRERVTVSLSRITLSHAVRR